MLQQAVDRIAPLVPAERVLIITSAVLQQPIRKAMPQLPAQNVIAEPAKRNTAPCLALAAAHIQAREGGNDAAMAVLTADHYIGNEKEFLSNVATALQAAEHHGSLVTLGIPPSRPETGYGYIERGDPNGAVHHVVCFKEKPDRTTAQLYLESERFLWNSGMFFWTVSSLHRAMIDHLPAVGQHIDAMATAITTNQSDHLDRLFAAMPDVSIDYGVMERAANVEVVPATFVWDDIGSWDALLRLHPLDDNGNVVIGAATLVDCHQSIIVNVCERGHVATAVGLYNAVLVVTDDASMVCPKDRAQDVKTIVQALRAQGRTDVL
jgi:mannose-1-phosphate guanylyltransferase